MRGRRRLDRARVRDRRAVARPRACAGDQRWPLRDGVVAQRKANEDALDAELSRALGALSADDCVARLRDAGVLVAPVEFGAGGDGRCANPEPRLFRRDQRAVVGTHLYPGAVARLPDTPLRADAPAPLLGEHNRQVFADLLGMSNDQITELERSGVIGSTPREHRSAK